MHVSCQEDEKEPLGNQYIIHNGDTLETCNIRYTLPNFELTLTGGRGSQLGGKPASKRYGCPNRTSHHGTPCPVTPS